MPDIRLSEEEMVALDGLPLLARCIYVFGLRPRMDFSTSYVGVRPRISYRSIAERVYVEPGQGRHKCRSGYPTDSAIRNAIYVLEGCGLLVRESIGRALIFRLPLAIQDQSVRNMSDRGATDKCDSTIPFDYMGMQYMNDRPDMPMSDTHPVSGISANSNYIPSCQICTTSTRAAGFRLGDALRILVDHGMPQQFSMNKDDRKLVSGWLQRGVPRDAVIAACVRGRETKRARNDSTPIGPRYIDRVITSMEEERDGKSRSGRQSGSDILAAGCQSAFGGSGGT